MSVPRVPQKKMITSQKLLLYVGCGSDINLPIALTRSMHAILIDSQPWSEFPPDSALVIARKTGYSRPWFQTFLDENSVGMCMIPAHRKKCCVSSIIVPKWNLLRNGHELYSSVAFPQRCPKEVLGRIKGCQVLYIKGFFPHASILKYMKKPVTFILGNNTWFEKRGPGFHDNTVVDWLWEKESIPRLYTLSKDGKELMKHRNMHEAWSHQKICIASYTKCHRS